MNLFSNRSSNVDRTTNTSDYTTSIVLKVFKATENIYECEKFHQEHERHFLKEYGNSQFESLDKKWFNDDNVFFIGAYHVPSMEILGGVKMHIANNTTELPMIIAAGKTDISVYEYIERMIPEKCCEIGSLWISRKGLVSGINGDHFILYFGALCFKLGINYILILAMEKSLKFLSKYGCRIISEFGQKGKFDYPSAEFPTYFSSMKITLQDNNIENDVLKTILEINSIPNRTIKIDNKKNTEIQFDEIIL